MALSAPVIVNPWIVVPLPPALIVNTLLAGEMACNVTGPLALNS